MKDTGRKTEALTLPNLLVIILILCFVVPLAIRNFQIRRRAYNHRTCYVNMKIINAAMVMYNVDHEVKGVLEGGHDVLEEPASGENTKVTYALLQEKGYLRRIPVHPGTHDPPEKVYRFDESGIIYCRSRTADFENDIHGYIEKP